MVNDANGLSGASLSSANRENPDDARAQKQIHAQNLKNLYALYVGKMCGAEFVEPLAQKAAQQIAQNSAMRALDSTLLSTIAHCHLCPRSKMQAPKAGYIQPESSIIFVVEFAMGEGAELFDSKGSQMLSNIAQNVFGAGMGAFSVFSLLKCGTHESSTQEREQCKPYLISQIKESSAKGVIVFGDVVLESLLGLDSTHKGVRLDLFGKHAIATHSISQLLRNPTLKKEALEHFLIMKKCLTK
ncbi:hypothetical protein BKN38_07320 [Helicobacter sp. CLO-3]|uniref:hypothetical protein n=1 Tax=unclassified Helicobacter TaxID=2593540 RepID=UPI0008054242|nr:MULTISPECIES: hypothetical protein [unclassified Helicobacter]OBV29395.1 hypothetical protein BA723_05575 [Helicobacter sp. CLO-3]OHU82339.1 hypothetical protein BKN38_07320 [Helicobacter sp. CLO-3]